MAANVPLMDQYGLSQAQQLAFLETGHCFLTSPDVVWTVAGIAPIDALVVAMQHQGSDGTMTLYFLRTGMVDANGQHPPH